MKATKTARDYEHAVEILQGKALADVTEMNISDLIATGAEQLEAGEIIKITYAGEGTPLGRPGQAPYVEYIDFVETTDERPGVYIDSAKSAEAVMFEIAAFLSGQPLEKGE